MLAKTKEKDVIDQLLDQIDFHGMTAEELAGENGLLTFGTAPFNGTIVASSVSLDSYKKNCQNQPDRQRFILLCKNHSNTWGSSA